MENLASVVTGAPPPIPAGCICSYTWHWTGDGRAVRNGALMSCPADHSAVDGAAART
jgi:hypothetical protein